MNACAQLEVMGEGRVALEQVAVEGRLVDLLAEVSLTQTYRNVETVNIEAVYTFPLPLYSVLLDLTVKLGDRELRGVISERQQATRTYEEAITDGNRAVLLEQVAPGLYTLNVGNLLPGEAAVITVRYGQLQRWTGDTLRFVLPTTVAPRYGDPATAGLAPHQTPDYSLLDDLHYTLRLSIDGALATSLIESPTHPVNIRREAGCTHVELGQKAALDRDFVLTLRAAGAACSSARIEQDGERHVVLATFNPRFNLTEDASPRSLKIVIDCSGSMGGDSIAQAREAVLRILESLRPQDRFNIVAFGSHYRLLFDRQCLADEDNRRRASAFARGLDADMGGTEVATALGAAFAVPADGDMPQDVLLVTDGEVWNTQDIIRQALQSRHRIFTVGVGSAVSEELVRQLAEQTGGASELVTPNENMAERIHRHFRRMFAPRAQRVEIRWPGNVELTHPKRVDTVYDGDTLHLFAWSLAPLVGDVHLDVTLPDGRVLRQSATITPDALADEGVSGQPGTLARMGVAARLRECTDVAEATRLAVAYQLMSPWTACTVVDVRAEHEQAQDLPALRKVPQMLAAGWGGSGSVCQTTDINFCLSYSPRKLDSLRKPSADRSWLDDDLFGEAGESWDEDLALAAELGTPASLITWLNDKLTQTEDLDAIMSLTVLAATVLPERIVVRLRTWVEAGEDERSVVIAFLRMVAGSTAGQKLSLTASRVIAKALKNLQPWQPPQDLLRGDLWVDTSGGWVGESDTFEY